MLRERRECQLVQRCIYEAMRRVECIVQVIERRLAGRQ